MHELLEARLRCRDGGTEKKEKEKKAPFSSCWFPHSRAALSMIHPDGDALLWRLQEAPGRGVPALTRRPSKMASVLSVVSLLAVLSAGLCVEEKTVLQRAGTAFNGRQYKSVLSVSNGEQFGNWTWPEMCPDTFFAVGFSLRVKTRTRSWQVSGYRTHGEAEWRNLNGRSAF